MYFNPAASYIYNMNELYELSINLFTVIYNVKYFVDKMYHLG